MRLNMCLNSWARKESAVERANEKWDICANRAKALVIMMSQGDDALRLRIMEEFRKMGIRSTYHPMEKLQHLAAGVGNEEIKKAAYETIVAILISGLRDSRKCPAVWDSTTVMRSAASSFQQIVDPRSVEPLIAVLDPEISGYVHWDAILALGRQRDPRGAKALAELLKNPDRQAYDQSYAYIAEALAVIGDKDAMEVAIQMQLLHRDPIVNLLALQAVHALLQSSSTTNYDTFDGFMAQMLDNGKRLDAIPVFLTFLMRWHISYDHKKEHLVKCLASLGPKATGYIHTRAYMSRDMKELQNQILIAIAKQK